MPALFKMGLDYKYMLPGFQKYLYKFVGFFDWFQNTRLGLEILLRIQKVLLRYFRKLLS
jgi:hypothetical protein